MQTDSGRIGFQIDIDDTQLKQGIQRAKNAFSDLGEQVRSECAGMDGAFAGVARAIGSMGAAWSLQEFARNVAGVRGEFQKLEVAMETLLRSKTKADTLMAQMVNTAATTPFGLQEVAGGAKQLLAYGIAVEDVNATLIKLGNIASGLSIPLGDLIYLYGTTMAQGRLYTQDLNQFTGRGIPLIRELSAQFGVAESEVKSLVEAGRVGFPQVQKAIDNLTGAGGMFADLMAKQAQTISGQVSNLQDQFTGMLNDIGRESEGAISGALESAAYLLDHYEQIGQSLITLAAGYGIYKASVMAVAALTNAAHTLELQQINALTAAKAGETDADLAAAVSKGRMTAARAAQVQAARMELKATIENAQAEAAAAAQAQHTAHAKMLAARSALRAKVEENRMTQAQIVTARAEGNAEALATLHKLNNAEATEINTLKQQLNTATTAHATAVTTAQAKAQAAATLTTKADTIAKQAAATKTTILTLATHGLTKAFHGMKAAFASNPFGMIMLAATMAASALMLFGDNAEEAGEEVTKFGEAAIKTQRNVDTLMAVVANTSGATKVHRQALEDLGKIYDEHGIKIDTERDKLQQLTEQYGALIAKIREEGEARQKANLLASYDNAKAETDKRLAADLRDRYASATAHTALGRNMDDYRAQAAELSTIVAAIIQSEAEGLATLTGEEYAKQRARVIDKIVGVYADMGLQAPGTADIREGRIIDGYVRSIRAVNSSRDTLLRGMRAEAENTGQAATDYKALGFAELFKLSATDTQAAQQITERMAEAVKTRKATADLLKQVGDTLDTAQAGSEEEKTLLMLKRRLDEQAEKFKGEKPKNAQGGKAKTDPAADIKRATEARDQALREAARKEEDLRAQLETDSHARRMKQLQIQQRREMEEIERARAEALKQEAERQAKGGAGDNSAAIAEQFASLAAIQAQLHARQTQEEQGRELQTLLAEYRTYEERREAIRKEYAEKRATAEAARHAALLQQLAKAESADLMRIALEELKASPDYAAAFADLGGTATDTLQALAQRLGELKTAAAEGMNPEDVRQYADALQRISDELTGRDPIKALAESYRELQAAAKELKAAQAALQSAKDGAAGADEEAKATERVAAAKKKHEEASRKFGKSEKQVQQQVGALCDEMKNLGDTIGGEAGKIVSLIGDIGNFVLTTGESMKAVSGMASESISTLEKATIVLQAITAAYQIAMKIAELFVGDDGMKAYENAQKLYKSYADTLREVAEAELTLMEATAGRDSEAAYRRATDLMAKQAEAARELGRQYLNAGANAGKHSNGLRQWRGISAKAWEQAAAAARKYGIDTERAFGGRMTGLFDLTAEQLKGLQHDAALFWASLADDTREYMEAVVNAAEQADEAAKRRAAHYTATDFDSLREEFKSAVSDMETSAADFADTFRNLIRNAIIEALMAKTYDSQIQALMDRFAAAMEDGSMGADELSALTAEKERIYRDLRAEVEAVNQFLGTSRKAQSGGTAGGFAAASQESVEELNGRFTAMQMDSAEIRALMAATAGEISRLATTAGQTWATADEIRGISLQCLDHLERIQRNTAELYEINTRLGRIERNTQ